MLRRSYSGNKWPSMSSNPTSGWWSSGSGSKPTKRRSNAAKENLDLAKGRYQVGVGSIIEVTDAQTLYTDAQTTYIRTLYDYKIAEAQFIRAIGQ